jgi:CPA2 family monovalent cation:H+ antiporter-2
MEIPLLKNVVIIIGLAVLVLLIFRKIRIPAILAFFVTGLLAGPHGLGLISSPDEVSLLADLGVIFLLFTIGIEFSLEKFSQIKRYVVIGGSLQLTLTLAAVYLICLSLGFVIRSIFIDFWYLSAAQAIVCGFPEKDQMDSIQGRYLWEF